MNREARMTHTKPKYNFNSDLALPPEYQSKPGDLLQQYHNNRERKWRSHASNTYTFHIPDEIKKLGGLDAYEGAELYGLCQRKRAASKVDVYRNDAAVNASFLLGAR